MRGMSFASHFIGGVCEAALVMFPFFLCVCVRVCERECVCGNHSILSPSRLLAGRGAALGLCRARINTRWVV